MRQRWYDDACGTAQAMELIGERWSVLIMRELMFGPRRFNQLRNDLSGISGNILKQRLEGLEESGLLTKRSLAPFDLGHAYELTPWGYESERAMQELGRWAIRAGVQEGLNLSPASLMMSFKTLFSPAEDETFKGALGFDFGSDQFVLGVTPASVTVTRGPVSGSDAVLRGSTGAVASVFYNGVSVADAVAAGSLVVEGDVAKAQRATGLFEIPPAISTAKSLAA